MEVVKHETCSQYVARRLSEGWKIVSQKGFEVVLESPEGIIRPVDLRNDVETLRPNAPGSENNIHQQVGCAATPNHYQCVDEEASDWDSSYVTTNDTTFKRDLYNLSDSIGSGTINKITLYFWARASDSGAELSRIKGAIKSGATIAESADKCPVTDFGYFTWGLYSQEWATNPDNAHAWIWDEIDALEAGVSMKREDTYSIDCTQVYVEVDYTPAAGLENKSANMAAKMVAAGLI